MQESVKVPVIILTRPQMGENIGAAARAMANFGLTTMRIVNPRDGWPNKAATSMASGAFDEGHVKAELFDTLAEALHDVNYAYATTARLRDLAKPVMIPRTAAEDATARLTDQQVAFVFGPERTGLENEEVVQCQQLVTVPTAPNFSSLNLGQCVLLIAHELFNARGHIAAEAPHAPARQKDFNALYDRLDGLLEDGRFFREAALRPTMTRNIKTMLMRAEMSEQEVRTYHGILSALVQTRDSAQKKSQSD